MDRLVEPGLIPSFLKATLEIKVFFVIKKATSENLRSLHHVSVACLQKPLRVLTTLAPRVFHIGDWSVPDHFFFFHRWVGFHFEGKNFHHRFFSPSVGCTTTERRQDAKRLQRRVGKFSKIQSQRFSQRGDSLRTESKEYFYFETYSHPFQT